MQRHVGVIVLLALAVIAAACGPSGEPDISIISDAQAAEPISGSSQITLTLRNDGDGDDRLVEVTTPSAIGVAMHLTDIEDGRAVMNILDDVPVPAGETVQFRPGHLHLMLEVPDPDVVLGATFELTLEFERSDPLTTLVEVVELLDLTEGGNDPNDADTGAADDSAARTSEDVEEPEISMPPFVDAGVLPGTGATDSTTALLDSGTGVLGAIGLGLLPGRLRRRNPAAPHGHHQGTKPRVGRRFPLIAAFVVVGLIAAACDAASPTSLAATGLPAQEDGWHGLTLDVERTLPSVTFEDVDGEPFNLARDLEGTPSLVFFGYTSCPDICPIHLMAIASAMEAARVSYENLNVVFVSVDPDRDTPDKIKDYLANFSTNMIGLHAPIEVVAEALDALNLPGPVVEGADPRGEGDLIGHPAQVIGFDAEGQAQRTWPFGARRADWVADLPRVAEEWS